MEESFMYIGLNTYLCCWYYGEKFMDVYGPLPDLPKMGHIKLVGRFEGEALLEARRSAQGWLETNQ